MEDQSVLFKFRFEDEIRRWCVHKGHENTINFDEVVSVIRQMFFPNSTATFKLKYKDEEGDVITVGSSMELREAIQCFQRASLKTCVFKIDAVSTASPNIDTSQPPPTRPIDSPEAKDPETPLNLPPPEHFHLPETRSDDSPKLNEADEEKRTISIKGFYPQKPSLRDITTLCSAFGTVVSCTQTDLIAPVDVVFEKEESAKKAVSELNGCVVAGHWLRAYFKTLPSDYARPPSSHQTCSPVPQKDKETPRHHSAQTDDRGSLVNTHTSTFDSLIQKDQSGKRVSAPRYTLRTPVFESSNNGASSRGMPAGLRFEDFGSVLLG